MTVDTHSDEYFEARRAELAERVGPRRFSHSLGVSQTAEQLAEVYGADAGEARIAGLLHDWDKGYDATSPSFPRRCCRPSTGTPWAHLA